MPVKGYEVITIPEEIHRILKKLSKETGKSMSQICCEAILHSLEKFETARSKVVEVAAE